MASAPPLRDHRPLTGDGTDPRGLTVGDILKMSPTEALMATLAVTGADEALVSGQPMMRPAEEVSDPWGLRLRDMMREEKQGAVRAMQNIPYSPLAAGVELAAPSAYDAMTREVPGANPEAPNMLTSLDNLSLGGLIEAPVAGSLLRTKAPNMRQAAPARLRGKLFDPQGESGPVFYSQARAVVEDPKTQGAQTGEAWLKFMTDPKRGVKAEELKYTRLGDFLKERGGQRVTRDEILGHLDANEIGVQEVTKGSPLQSDVADAERVFLQRLRETQPRYSDQQARDLALDVARGEMPLADLGDSLYESGSRLRETYAARQAGAATLNRATKFGQYTLPGAKNYREVLLTLPAKASAVQVSFDQYARDYREIYGRNTTDAEIRPRYEAFVTQAQRGEAPDSGVFKSGHWDEPNVLAHLRLSDREDADGKRVLLVEEIQSDWAQKGRKEGFADAGSAARRREIEAQMEALAKDRDPRTNQMRDEQAWHALASEREGIDRRQSRSVPEAPFVGDTSKWVNLSLKRILRMAADEGYDRIGIVRGEEQAARYDLSKHLDTVKWERDVGTGRIHITGTKGGSEVVSKSSEPSKLDEVVGKELADKILATGKGHGEMSGLDLKVGGEGMKAFYDEIVPQALDKLAKEHGVKVQREGGKVGDASVRSLDQIDAEMDRVVEELGGRDWSEREDLFRKHQALQKERNRAKEGAGEVPIHVLDVPEPMKKSIKKKGFPLYSSLTLGQMMGAQNA